MAFYLDDVPAEQFVIEPPGTIALDQFTDASAVLVDPAGVATPLTAAIDDTEGIVVTQPAAPFSVPGVHRLAVTLSSATASQRIPEARFVVIDPDSEWHTLDTIREDWPDGETIADATLAELLDVVRGQVLEFAPAIAEGVPVPAHYRLAQRLQVRNTWNAAKVSPAGEFGGDEFVIRPFPLDWHVKQILRPKRGVPVVA